MARRMRSCFRCVSVHPFCLCLPCAWEYPSCKWYGWNAVRVRVLVGWVAAVPAAVTWILCLFLFAAQLAPQFQVAGSPSPDVRNLKFLKDFVMASPDSLCFGGGETTMVTYFRLRDSLESFEVAAVLLQHLQLSGMTVQTQRPDGSSATVIAPGFGSDSGSRLLVFDLLEVEVFGFVDTLGFFEKE